MRLIWVLINLVFWTIVLATIGLLGSILEHRGRFFGHIARLWSWLILKASGVQYSVHGLAKLNPDQQYVFVANHESAFDIPLAFAGLPYQLTPISKVELRKIPLFGWAMRAAKHVFVDRHNHEAALISLEAAVQSLHEIPRSVLVFPEGTRSLDGKIHAFKKGGIVLAIKAGLPIVPMAMCGTAGVVTKGSWNLSPKPVELHVGNPIPTESYQYSDRNQLTEKIRQQVMDMKAAWKSTQTVGN